MTSFRRNFLPVSLLSLAALLIVGQLVWLLFFSAAKHPYSIRLVAEWENQSAVDMQRFVAIPLEEKLSVIPGVQSVNTVCTPGRCEIYVKEVTFVDLPPDNFKNVLPQNVSLAIAAPEEKLYPVCFALEGNVDPALLRKIAETQVAAPLEQLPFVTWIDVKGGAKPECVIAFDEKMLEAKHLSINEMIANVFAGSGFAGTRITPEELGNASCTLSGEDPVKLKDVAQVSVEKKNPDEEVTVNGKEAVLIGLVLNDRVKQKEAAAQIDEVIEKLKTNLPKTVSLQSVFNETIDRSSSRKFATILLGSALLLVLSAIFLLLFSPKWLWLPVVLSGILCGCSFLLNNSPGEKNEQALLVGFQIPEQNVQLLDKIDKRIAACPGVEMVMRRNSRNGSGNYFIRLEKGRTETSEEIVHRLRKVVDLPGTAFQFAEVSSDAESPRIAEPAIRIKISGNSTDNVIYFSDSIIATLHHLPGIVDVMARGNSFAPEQSIIINVNAVNQHGIPLSTVQEQLQWNRDGKLTGYEVEDDAEKIPVRVKYARDADDLQALRNMPVQYRDMNQGGLKRSVPLSALADIQMTNTPGLLLRENGRDKCEITTQVDGADEKAVRNAVANEMRSVRVPAGMNISVEAPEVNRNWSWKVSMIVTLFLLVASGLLMRSPKKDFSVK